MTKDTHLPESDCSGRDRIRQTCHAMFIAHLPAGYIGACVLEKYGPSLAPSVSRWFFRLFVIGSLLPDIDMFYFYLVDHRAHHHHLYWTHLPVFWIAVYATGLLWALAARSRTIALLSASLFAGVILHLILDTPMGGVAWLYPFSKSLIYLTTVPARYDWWVWNFFFHWTFLLEILICFVAGALYYFRQVARRRVKKDV